MKNIFRRPTASEAVESAREIAAEEKNNATPNAEEGNDKPEFIESDGVRFALLITATNNSEEAVIESVLRAASIPYVVRENDGESWMRVFMGFNFYGVDFYVPENLLDDAAELLVPSEDGKEQDADGEDDGE